MKYGNLGYKCQSWIFNDHSLPVGHLIAKWQELNVHNTENVLTNRKTIFTFIS